mgnify:FL=1
MRKPKEVLQQSILANKLKRIMSETDYCPIDFLDSVKLNKSDVISSVCNHRWKTMRNTHYLYRCTKCGIPNEMQTDL